MQPKPTTIEQYLEQLPDDRKPAVEKLRKVILENLPDGFTETFRYRMIGFVVPHALYPAGYHCAPQQPLTFISLASQKNFVALYHMGLYADTDLLQWWTNEYPRHSKTKLDMGKSCIRFKKPEHIPFELIAELCTKMTVQQWIEINEATLK
jgi:hypothetical protein